MAGPLAGRKEELLRGIDPAWGACIDDVELDKTLTAIDALGDADVTAPPPGLIFEALRYGGPRDVSVVILGQDPYPTAGDAQGLCFSVGGGQDAPALVRVMACLDRAGLRKVHAGPGGAPVTSGDLRPWAVQRVLMLNAALTTRLGARGVHAKLWKPFVAALVGRFCAAAQAARTVVHFLLWGNDARAFAGVAERHGHAVHAWTHPSPMADNRLPLGARFRECPHFEDVNRALTALGRPAIVWDNLAYVAAFSDGSCPLNGKPGARAAFASVITGGHFGTATIRGEILPCEYEFADERDPALGVVGTDRLVAPSNNRGELMGIIYCELALLRGRALGRVEIISDSNNCVKTLLEWLPARRQKGTERELKNLDLVLIADRLLACLREQALEVAITHTRSHQARPPPSAPPRDLFVWLGNHKADEHAGLCLRETPTYAVEVMSGPPVVRALAQAGA